MKANTFTYILNKIATILFLLSTTSVFAHIHESSESIETANISNPVIIGQAIASSTTDISTPNPSQSDQLVLNKVQLEVNLHSPFFIPGNHQYVTVEVKIRSFNAQNVEQPVQFKQLTIDYYKDNYHQSKILDEFIFYNNYKVDVEIVGIWVEGNVVTTLPANLKVNTVILVERYTQLITTTNAYNITQSLSSVSNPQYLNVSWQDIDGAEEYQFEFAHINNVGPHNGSSYTALTPNDLSYDFKNNSTRVTVTGNNYEIPLVFDQGYVFYRVRALGVSLSDVNKIVYAEWSTPSNTGQLNTLTSKYEITEALAHETRFNWQYAATYAEEGKRKDVITYYDGTLRNRQAVTKINTDLTTIVGETIYDHVGRPAATILPVPVVSEDDKGLKFHPNFNQSANQTAYDKTNFDTDQKFFSTDPLNENAGAALYYSSNNPDQDYFQGYVPDAAGYPIQITRFEPNGTGKIMTQSGVGSEFQIGSGRETRYLYGNPNQLELNRLFGSEVGYAAHYKKNAVVDANGQVSISYLDLSDKVIATALAGLSPANLNEIDPASKEKFSVEYLNVVGAEQVVDQLDQSILFSTNFIVTDRTIVELDYTLQSIQMLEECLPGICVDCAYELTYSLKDINGNELLENSTTNEIIGSFEVNEGNPVFHATCNSGKSTSFKDSIILEIGSYTISKKLKLHQASLEQYLAMIEKSSCMIPFEEFLNAELANIDSASCVITCDNCMTSLGTLADFIGSGSGSSADYYERVKLCDELCDTTSRSDCESHKMILEGDMSPGGQYGEYLNAATGTINLNIPLSIFNADNVLPNIHASWRNPKLLTPNGIQSIYVDESGDRSRIVVLQSPDDPAIYNPAPQLLSQVQTDPITGEKFIYPEHLANVQDFISLFKPSWAQSLIYFHPEYCYYEECISYDKKYNESDVYSSSSFDIQLRNITTFLEAQANNFIGSNNLPTNWSNPVAGNPTDDSKPWDPFIYRYSQFGSSSCDNFAQKLQNKITHYQQINGVWYSMKQIAAVQVRCGTNYSGSPDPSCFDFGGLYNGNVDTEILNSEWNVYKSLYLSAKQELQQDLANCKAFRECRSSNFCFGDEKYNPFYFLFMTMNGAMFEYPFFVDPLQPCNISTFLLYRNKIKRFGNAQDLIDKYDANNLAYQAYTQTGQCPTAFSLEGLIGNLASTELLVEDGHFLTNNGHFASLLQAHSNYNIPQVVEPIRYDVTTTSTLLTANLVNTTSNTIFATLTLTKPTTIDWTDFFAMNHLVATGPNSFTINAVYQKTINYYHEGPVLYETVVIDSIATLNGTITYFNLNGCTFQNECTSNQLASDITIVMNVLNQDNLMLSTQPVALSTYSSTNIPDGSFLSSLYIQNAANVGANLYWKNLGGGLFSITGPTNSSTNGLYIELDVNPTALTNITAIGNIISTGDYSFNIEILSANGFPTTVSGILYRDHNGVRTGIKAGDCSLPTPNHCQAPEYKRYEDLQNVLRDVLVGYDGTSAINLFSSVELTPDLMEAFPYETIVSTSDILGRDLMFGYTTTLNNNPVFNPIISLKNDNQAMTSNFFSNIIGINNFQIDNSNPSVLGSTSFTFNALYSNQTSATISGHTTFFIKACEECLYPDETPVLDILDELIENASVVGPDGYRVIQAMSTPSGCNSYESWINCSLDFRKFYGIDPIGATLSPQLFEDLGLCDCGDDLCALIEDPAYLAIAQNTALTVEERLLYLFSNINCQDLTCFNAYETYTTAVTNFNAASSYTISPITLQTFMTEGYCSCVENYENLLLEIISTNQQFASEVEFNVYTHIQNSCIKCERGFIDYTTFINSFNLASPSYQITPSVSEVVFNASNYCTCIKTYNIFLNNILTNIGDYQSQQAFDAAVDINTYCNGGIHMTSDDNSCKQYFHIYQEETNRLRANNPTTFDVKQVSYNDFLEYKLCDCLENYSSTIDMIIAELNPEVADQYAFDKLLISSLTCNIKPSCGPAPYNNLASPMPEVDVVNNCIQLQHNLAITNAQMAYDNYRDDFLNQYRNKYINYCMNTNESLTHSYYEKIGHYTLYYYDKAGNLIKTIPPAGVNPLAINSESDDLNIQVNLDRKNGERTVYTSHTLQTRYEYNSLNQLIAQSTPDTDPLDTFNPTQANGLHASLSTQKVQMINGSTGYLSGYVNDRAYFYSTTDGGTTWNRMFNLISSNFRKSIFVSNTQGFAIGDNGIIVFTIDGGVTWDYLSTLPMELSSENWIDISFNMSITDKVVIVSEDRKVLVVDPSTLSIVNHYELSSNPDKKITSIENHGTDYVISIFDQQTGLTEFLQWNSSSSTSLNTAIGSNWTAVNYVNDNLAYAASADGRIFKSVGTDFNWLHIASNLNEEVKQLEFFNELQGVALVGTDVAALKIYRTFDGGKTWSKLNDHHYNQISLSVDKSELIALGNEGLIHLLLPMQNANNSVVTLFKHPDMTDLTAGWIFKNATSTYEVLVADDQHLYYSANAGITQPVWNKIALTTSIKKIVSTKVSNSLIGAFQTTSDEVFKFSKQQSTALTIEATSIGQFKNIVAQPTEIYLHTNSSNSLQKTNWDISNIVTTIGTLASVHNSISIYNSKIAVCNTSTATKGVIDVSSIDLLTANRIYVGKINKLINIGSNVLALGDDGIQMLLGNNEWSLQRNSINSNIYGASVSGTDMIVVGSHGMVKKVSGATLLAPTYVDLNTTSYQRVEDQLPSTNFYGVKWLANGRLYVVGSGGTILYSSDFNNQFFQSLNILPATGQQTLYDVASKPTGNTVTITGANNTISDYTAILHVARKEIFLPPIKDFHFYDANKGSIIFKYESGKAIMARKTINGGNWSKVEMPQNLPNTSLVTKTLHLSPDKILFTGIEKTLLHSNNVTSIVNTLSVSDVKVIKRGNNANTAYLIDGGALKSWNFNTLTSSVINGTLLSSSEIANDMHLFKDGSYVIVGNNGLYKRYSAAGALLASSEISPTLSADEIITNGNELLSVAFYDNLNGVIVGSNGSYYKTTNNQVTNDGYLASTTWVEKNLSSYGVTPATNTTIQFASATNLVLGSFNGAYKIFDAGDRYSSRFFYDKLGRLVVSQNARQSEDDKYSYTLYDSRGRVYEAGEKTENSGSQKFKNIFGTPVNGYYNPSVIDDLKLSAWIHATGTRREVTRSYYDKERITGIPGMVDHPQTQNHRITHVTYETLYDGLDETYDHATHYLYDIHGNVKTLIQDNRKLAIEQPSLAQERFKRLDYYYDLVSGNVNRMSVQAGENDQWHHAYEYDADNRINRVYTNTKLPLVSSAFIKTNVKELGFNSDWQLDAQYYYYKHGPLARVELGQNNLQGVDYYYTLQGWLKGVNSSIRDKEKDPGQDSDNLALAAFAKDVFGFGLHYFQGDYTAINGQQPFATVEANSHADLNSHDLYNGNIRYMQTAITDPNTYEAMPMLTAYQYDQLNRLNASRSYEDGLSNNIWSASNYNNSYFNEFTFDAMGNILTQNRANRSGKFIDSLTYNYQYANNNINLLRNRLYSVNDLVEDADFDDDIDDMGNFNSNSEIINEINNYSYDAEGRLIRDEQEGIAQIVWRVDGKVSEIIRAEDSAKDHIKFEYNAMGQRIAKHVYTNATPSILKSSTYYILDAQGNQLSMYEHKVNESSAEYYLKERNIYGSSRVGMNKDTINMFNAQLLPSYGVTGNRNYELSNHLGNVLAVVSDNFYPISEDNSTISEYRAGINQVYDYSPFGVQLDERTIEPDPLVVTETDYLVHEEWVYTSNFNINHSQLSNYDGWKPNPGTSALFIESGKLKVVSYNTTSGTNRDFATVSQDYYKINFNAQLSTSSSITVQVTGVVNGSTVTLVNQVISATGAYSYEFYNPGATLLNVKFVQNGIFYIDNFSLQRRPSTIIEHNTIELPAAVSSPSINGWTYNPATTYAWATGGNLYARNGALTRTYFISPVSNQACQIAINIGTNTNVKVKVTTTMSNLTTNIQEHTFTSNGTFNFTHFGNVNKTVITVTPTGTSDFYIDQYVGLSTDNFTSISSVPAEIQGWRVNSQTHLLEQVSTTNNTNKAIEMGTRIYKSYSALNPNSSYEFSFRDITTSSGRSALLGLTFNDENEMEESFNQDQMISPLAVFYDYNIKIYELTGGNETGGSLLLNQDFNLTNATKIITFTSNNSTDLRIEITGKKIGDFNNPFTYAVDDLKLRKLNSYTTVYTNSFSSTVMTTNALDGWQPDSWNTTSATLDYVGGNHRLVAIGSNATATVQRDFTTNANEQHSLSYNLALLNGGSATVKVQQKVGNTYYDLAGSAQTHTASGTYNFNFTPSEDDIRVVVAGTSRYALTQIFMDRNTIEEVTETYTLSAGGYRYGFQGMEKDDEAKGKGNSYDFGARLYDSRLGRWLSVDPLAGKQPDQSPYKAFYNNPLIWQDPDGKTEFLTLIIQNEQTGEMVKISVPISDKIMTDGKKQMVGSSATWHYENAYYDYEQVYKYTIDKDGVVHAEKYTKILYHRGVKDWDYVWFDGAKKGDTKRELDFYKQKGGFYMTSSQGKGTKYHSANSPDYVGNIDDLLAVLDRAGPEWTPAPNAKLPSGPYWEAVDILLKTFERQAELVDRVIEIKEAVEEQVKGGASSNEMSSGSVPYSNKEYMNKPEGSPNNGSSRFKANQEEKEVGDTVGGNPNIKIYPK